MWIFTMLIFFCYRLGCLWYTWFARTIRPEGISWGHPIHFSHLEKVCNNPNKTINHTAWFSSQHGEELGLGITSTKPPKNQLCVGENPWKAVVPLYRSSVLILLWCEHRSWLWLASIASLALEIIMTVWKLLRVRDNCGLVLSTNMLLDNTVILQSLNKTSLCCWREKWNGGEYGYWVGGRRWYRLQPHACLLASASLPPPSSI